MASSKGSSFLNSAAGTARLMKASSWGLNKLRDSVDRIVEGVPFHGVSSCLADESFDLRPCHPLFRGRARAMDDAFFDDRSIEIVSAEPQRHLRQRRRQGHPVRLDMRKVIQHETRDGDRLEVIYTSRRREAGVERVFRVERQGNETLKSP